MTKAVGAICVLAVFTTTAGDIHGEDLKCSVGALPAFASALSRDQQKDLLDGEALLARLRRSDNARVAQAISSDIDDSIRRIGGVILALTTSSSPPQPIVELTKCATKLRNDLLDTSESKSAYQEFPSGRWGIAPGIMYAQGTASRSYISGAYVDLAGYVRIKEDLRTITRVFPTFTGYVRPAGATKPFYAGFTLGVNEGKVSANGGFALAMGPTLGFVFDNNVHFGVFIGQIVDPTVQVLPNFIFKNGPLPPVSPTVATAPSLASGYQIPTESVVGRYRSVGVVLSYSF